MNPYYITIRAPPMACKRSFRSFVSVRSSSLRKYPGVPAGSAAQSGSNLTRASSTSGVEAPLNARFPVSIWNTTAPREKISLRLSTGRPIACSGDMYGIVPAITDSWVKALVTEFDLGT